MWSCRLGKIKKSITNSAALADASNDKKTQRRHKTAMQKSYFFTKIGHWQHLLELIVASNVLALVLTLAEAGTWAAFDGLRLLQYILFINWVIFAFSALIDRFQSNLHRLPQVAALGVAFVLLQMIVLLTTIATNLMLHWGSHFHFHTLTWPQLFSGASMHLSYGVLLGGFCLRYMYMRDQWLKQQYSELNARIQAMQARIHPHFLFNSLNNVVSLISIDPEKAETLLIHLSRLFRASFQELKLVSLADEIELCQRYLAIESVRLGSRLQVEWKFDPNQPQFQQVQIPLLTLQPLLENCIFHGVEPSSSRSTITILVEILQSEVSIVITNPYSPDKIKSRNGHGIAVENVKQRLIAYYGRTVKFQNYCARELYTTVVSYQYRSK
ncbi:histidine kinase [uncultured Acinetobacter sp.]|uniref:sensor histidine kinase n=1 Tax=uncultured Acinetobacter sp. TaxID=165433 RepID=UPI00258A018E|nr:histidine kinase [uncultured Acinetobacter sp.]